MCPTLTISGTMTRRSSPRQIPDISGAWKPLMKIQRVRFSTEADNRLRMLKARTGLTPNIICRLGLCISLEEPGEPRSYSYGLSQREINRYTLHGEYDQLFVALLRTRHPEET